MRMMVPQRSGTTKTQADLPGGRPLFLGCGRKARRRWNHYGKQVQDRDGQTAAEVLNPAGSALQVVWAPTGCVSQIRALPTLLSEVSRSGFHSGSQEGELVIEKT